MSLHVARTVTTSPSDPTTPAFADTLDWLTAYLTIHSLSANSYVYMYLLWLLAAAAFLALCIATWTGVRGGALGARWQRWALRRRTWRKKHALKRAEQDARRKGLPTGSSHRQPVALPSNAQLLSAFVLFAVAFALCFAGPDYINPDLPFLSFSSTYGTTSASASTVRREVSSESLEAYIPHYTISKSFWSSAARTGGIAFSLFPLVITLALKAPPFAILAIPGLVGYAHDKTIRLHRYAGRLIWFVTTLHVVFWVVQVCRDRRADTGKLAIVYVWEYPKFRYAWIVSLPPSNASDHPQWLIFYTGLYLDDLTFSTLFTGRADTELFCVLCCSCSAYTCNNCLLGASSPSTWTMDLVCRGPISLGR